MYSNPNSPVNIQDQMRRMLAVELIAAEIRFGFPRKSSAIVKEFDDMLSAGSTVTGGDPARSISEYVYYHYMEGRAPIPLWYDELINPSKFGM